MTSSNFWSSFVHGLAGVVVFAGSFAFMGVPASWQALTIGGVLALILKWAHLAYSN